MSIGQYFDHNDVKIEGFPIFRSNYENNLDRNIDPRETPKFSRHYDFTTITPVKQNNTQQRLTEMSVFPAVRPIVTGNLPLFIIPVYKIS